MEAVESIVLFYAVQAMIGLGLVFARRGWPHELLHMALIVLVLFMYDLVEGTFLHELLVSLAAFSPTMAFVVIMMGLTALYTMGVLGLTVRPSSPPRRWSARALGLILGLINGYLVVGTVLALWRLVLYPAPHTLSVPPEVPATHWVRALPLTGLTPWLTYLLVAMTLLLVFAFR